MIRHGCLQIKGYKREDATEGLIRTMENVEVWHLGKENREGMQKKLFGEIVTEQILELT